MKTEYLLDNGKYTIVYEDDYPKEVLRYGSTWINCLDNAHVRMAVEIDRLSSELERAIDVIESSGVDYDEVMEQFKEGE